MSGIYCKNNLLPAFQALDCTPFIGSAWNITILFLKIVRPLFPSSTTTQNHFWHYIQHKPVENCLMLCIPIVGNVVALFFYYVHNSSSARMNRELLDYATTQAQRDEIQDITKAIPDEEKEEFLACVHKLFHPGLGSKSLLSILNTIQEIPHEERTSVVESARTLIIATMSGDEIKLIVDAVKKTSVEERETAVESAKKFLDENRLIIDARPRALLIQVIGTTPQHQKNFITCFLTGLQSRDLQTALNGLNDMPREERTSFLADIMRCVVIPETNPIERMALFRVLCNIPAHQRTDALNFINTLKCRYAMTTHAKAQILTSIAEKSPTASRLNILQSVRALITRGPVPSWTEIPCLIESIANITDAERASVLEFVQEFMSSRRSLSNIPRLISCVTSISCEERQRILPLVKKFDVSDEPADTIIDFIRAIHDIPGEKNLEQWLRVFITPEMPRLDDCRISLVITIATVLKSDEDALLTLTQRCVTPKMPAIEKNSIIRGLQTIPPSEREVVAQYVQTLTTFPMFGTQYFAMIQTIGKIIPASERASILTHVRSFSAPNMTYDTLLSLIRAIQALDPAQSQAILRHAHTLITTIPTISSAERSLVIAAVSRITSGDEDSVVQAVKRFANPNGLNISALIDSIARIPTQERAAVLELANTLIIQEFDNTSRARILIKVYDIDAARRTDLVQIMSSFAHHPVSVRALISLIPLLTALSNEEGREILRLTEILITPALPGAARIQIFKALHEVSTTTREAVVQAVLPQMQENADLTGFEIADLIEETARQFFPLQTRHGEGLDVHDENRDIPTRAAVELLRQQNPSLSPTEITQAVEAFTQFLEGCTPIQVAQEKKARAQRALTGPRKHGEVFPPLFDGATWSIHNLTITGQELIARLWLFASSLPEPNATQAKGGMITALADSFYDDGTLVCNPGKAQRLLVAALQGFLPGVDIERTEATRPPTKNEALEQFFNNPVHKDINTQPALIAAAVQFFTESPLITQELRIEILKDLATFAFRQDMPPLLKDNYPLLEQEVLPLPENQEAYITNFLFVAGASLSPAR